MSLSTIPVLHIKIFIVAGYDNIVSLLASLAFDFSTCAAPESDKVGLVVTSDVF